MKAYRNDESGALYHDSCFEKGETRDGYTQVSDDDIDADDVCESCQGEFEDVEDVDDAEGEDESDDTQESQSL